jgi:hypothetical protein
MEAKPMKQFDVSTVPHHWRLGGDGKWLRSPRAALDAVSELLTQENLMFETTSEDLRRLVQRLKQTLTDDDIAALVNMLMSDDTSGDQPPLQPKLLAPEKSKYAADARRRFAAHERAATLEAKRLAESSKRWPQAARLGIGG